MNTKHLYSYDPGPEQPELPLTPDRPALGNTAHKQRLDLPVGSNVAHCTACGETFNSVYPFDLHRIGEFGKDRRCLTVLEMQERGWVKNKRGLWITKAYDGPARG